MERKNIFLNTYTGKQIKIISIKPDDICLPDIAHSLSMICRFNGHCSFFYSVAQHSISIFNELKNLKYSPKIQLYGLLHDAAEAYICDLPKPIKIYIPQYRKLESKIQKKIWKAFNIPKPTYREYKIIKELDVSMMQLEANMLMKNMDINDLSLLNLKAEVAHVSSDIIEKEFLEIGEELLKQIKQ